MLRCLVLVAGAGLVVADVRYCDPLLERAAAGARCAVEGQPTSWRCCAEKGETCYRRGVRATLVADARPSPMIDAGADGWCMPAMNPMWDESTAYVEPHSQPVRVAPTTTTTSTTTTTLPPATAAPTADARVCLGAHENCQRVNQQAHLHDRGYNQRHCNIFHDAGYGCHWGWKLSWVPCTHTTCKIEMATRVGGVSTPSFIKVLHPPCPKGSCDSKDHHHNGGGAHRCKYDAEEYKCTCHCARRAVDGGFSSWSAWGSCTKSCGAGQQERSRTCTRPAPMFGGRECAGATAETRSCNPQGCPVNGGFSAWSSWSACPKTCGGGSQTRARTCTAPAPAHNGLGCVGDSAETRSCAAKPCPVDGVLSQWSDFSVCTKSCGGGVSKQSRTCSGAAHGGKDCDNSDRFETGTISLAAFTGLVCKTYPFKQSFAAVPRIVVTASHDGHDEVNHDAVSMWTEWTTRSHFRACWREVEYDDSHDSHMNLEYMAWVGDELGAAHTGTITTPSLGAGRSCFTHTFDAAFATKPLVIGSIDHTGIYDTLDHETIYPWIEEVTAKSFRVCFSETAHDGVGEHHPVKFHFMAFTKNAFVLTSAQGRAGALGGGSNFMGKKCNTITFDKTFSSKPIVLATVNHHSTTPQGAHEGVIAWADAVTTTSFRLCVQELRNGGEVDGLHDSNTFGDWVAIDSSTISVDAHTTQRACGTQACPVHGGFSPWGGWSSCSKTCGGGTRSQTRACTNPAPAHGGPSCAGATNRVVTCNTKPCPIHGGFSPWGAWTACSKTCGGGKAKRTRTCTSPAPAHGGRGCAGAESASQGCNKQACPPQQVVAGHNRHGSSKDSCANPNAKAHAVRCCANTKPTKPSGQANSGLHWTKKAGCSVWAESDGDGTCHVSKSLAEARTICAAQGARLCSAKELRDNCAAGTGCNHDDRSIWSADGCQGRQVVAGHNRNGSSKDSCAYGTAVKHAVRCCADTKPIKPSGQANSGLHWTKKAGCSVWGETDGDGTCHGSTSFAGARAICAAQGARLCTAKELRDNCAAGTGCNHDDRSIWSADGCTSYKP